MCFNKIKKSIGFHLKSLMLSVLLMIPVSLVLLTHQFPMRDFPWSYSLNWLSLFFLAGVGYGFFGEKRHFFFMGHIFDNLIILYSLLGAVASGVVAAIVASGEAIPLDPLQAVIPMTTFSLLLIYGFNKLFKHRRWIREVPVVGFRWSDDMYGDCTVDGDTLPKMGDEQPQTDH